MYRSIDMHILLNFMLFKKIESFSYKCVWECDDVCICVYVCFFRH